MKTKFPISLSITIMITFHLVIILANWFVLKQYNDSIKNDAKVINTIGQIRGGSQKYFKEYFYDGTIENKNYIEEKFTQLKKLCEDKFQNSHEEIEDLYTLWKDINQKIKNCKTDKCKNDIFLYSDNFWHKSDKTVKLLEIESENKNNLIKIVFVILFLEILFVSFMIIVVYKLVNDTLESQKKKMETYINLIDKYVITSSTDLEGNITYVSDAFCNISGYTKNEIIGKNHNIVRHEDMPKNVYEIMWETIKNQETWSGELKNKTKDGRSYWVKAYISPIYEDKKHIGYTAIREDITAKRNMEELSVTDPLTALYNRRKFHEIATMELNRLKRDIQEKKENIHQVFFILLDVDNFKLYNDTYGHDKGDAVLKEVANCLRFSLKRSTDFAFRIGGEEFGLIVIDDNLLNVKELADNIRQNIENLKIEHTQNTASSYVTASLGIGMSNEHFGYDLDGLYNRADKALYRAKETGRNKVEVYKLVSENDG